MTIQGARLFGTRIASNLVRNYRHTTRSRRLNWRNVQSKQVVSRKRLPEALSVVASAAADPTPPPDWSLDSILSVVNHLPDVASTLLAHSPPPPDPVLALTTVALVTANDVVPFIPCQPLVVAVASQLGVWAYPLCVTGQTLAGLIAFASARTAAQSTMVQNKAADLLKDNPKALEKFRAFQNVGSNSSERTVFLALLGLRVTPIFPFSIGNYLLGSATRIGYRPFVVATFLGCCISQSLSVSVGMGGAEIIKAYM